MRGTRMARLAGVLVLGGSVLLAGACGGKPESRDAAPPVVRGVEVMTVSASPRDTFAEAVGTIRARNVAAVAPQVMGRVAAVNFSEGSRVRKGELLASIDDAQAAAQLAQAEGGVAEAEGALAEAEAAVAQAEAGRLLAERTFERYRRLHDEKVITPQEFDEVSARRTLADKEYQRAVEKRVQAKARISQAKSRVRAARALHGYAEVTAPFSGIVTEKKIEAGSMAVPGQPIAVIEDPSAFRLEALVPEEFLTALKAGSRVEVVLDPSGEKGVPAVISEIVPAVDPVSRTFVVKADLSAPGLRTGLFGRLRFPTGRGNVLAVPQAAIAQLGGYEGVFLITPDNVARLAMVRTGRRSGDRVEVVSGLDPGARIAASGVDRLTDGAKVEIGAKAEGPGAKVEVRR